MNALDQIDDINASLRKLSDDNHIASIVSILLDIQDNNISIIHVKTTDRMYQYIYNPSDNQLTLLRWHML